MSLWSTKKLRTASATALLLAASCVCHARQAGQQSPPSTPETNPSGTSRENGERVVAVRIVTEDGRVLSDSPAEVSVQVGRPIDRGQVAESIRALYRTGDYTEIRAVSAPVPGGVRADFVVKEQLFFNQLLIRGLTAPPTDSSALAAMQLALGEPYQSALVDEGVERLRDALHEDGLYLAEISVQTVPYPQTRQIDIIVNIKPGPRARVREIQLQNETEYRATDILSRLKMRPGREVTASRLHSGTERIRKFLVKKSHLSARAVVRRGPYDPKTNTLALQLEVTEGPRVRLTVTGAKLSSGELKKLVPVYQEGTVDTDLLEEGKRNILERLERSGYFDTEVDYATSTHEVQLGGTRKGTEELITYHVERGEKHKLLGIEIVGNHYFDASLLRSRLQISGRAFGTRGRFSRRLLEADRQSMLNVYLSNGFLEAKVDVQAVDNYGGKEGDLLVRFVVKEGKQTRVASLQIAGVRALPEPALRSVIASTPGQPYSDFNVATDRDNILALYYNEGFPSAQFTAKAERINGADAAYDLKNESKNGETRSRDDDDQPNDPAFEGDLVRLIYDISEGKQIRAHQVLLTGYRHTRQGVVRREVQVQPDAPLRQGDVVESQRRLYNLGVFNRVTIQPQNPNGEDTSKNVVVLVEEAKRYTLGYGGGFEVQRLASTSNPIGSQVQAAVRGILEFSKLNLTGRGDSLSFKLRGSTIEDRALLGYSDPNPFGNRHLTFQASAYTERTQDINTFTEERYEGSLQLNHALRAHTSILYHYAFRKVLVTHINSTLSPAEIPLFSAPTLISQIGATWVRDARDNPADATKGNFNSFDFSVADSRIGSSASFWRAYFQNSTYHPIKRRFSFARGIRFGILEPYNDTVSLKLTAPAPGACIAAVPTTTLTPSVIPLPERFFAGGGTSLRGFALNQAGPRDPCTGFPIGGQAILIFNQEFRFPMRLPYVGTSVSGALFYDGGNVYSRLGRISFRPTLPDPVIQLLNPSQPASAANTTVCVANCTNELNYFSHTVGMGFRYATPVGPIRIDLGYQLNRPRFVAPICRPGVAASACLQGRDGFQTTRLPGFQIFFNLGSNF
jgi:outer membrane protein insertion porin family